MCVSGFLGDSVPSCTLASTSVVARSSESTPNSRDCSPSRSSPFGVNVRSPVVLRRGARGYGFSLSAIRVFYSDSGYFTLHHMISVCFIVHNRRQRSKIIGMGWLIGLHTLSYDSLLLLFFLIPSVVKIPRVKS